jgi:hypothetical protein
MFGPPDFFKSDQIFGDLLHSEGHQPVKPWRAARNAVRSAELRMTAGYPHPSIPQTLPFFQPFTYSF